MVVALDVQLGGAAEKARELGAGIDLDPVR
jgi:hypothetical protein